MIKKKKKKNIVIQKNLHDLVISKIRFFDIKIDFFFIKNSGLLGDITKSFMWYQKIIFVISQSQGDF